MAFGGSIKLTGESEYRKALNNITSNLKVMASEMQIVTATYGANDKSVQSLSEKNQVLNKQIDAQKDKVEVLKSALEASKSETGENSTTTQKWQVELNKATAQLVSMEKEVKTNEETMKRSSDATEDNASSVKDLGEEASKSGTKVLSLGDIIKANLISDVIKKGISELVDGLKALGSTFIDVGKQALGSYADYEQLVGGVDTLFKENSQTVQNYANNAYKTAGMSANQYMETVTSFSASLLQSLNGDTAKSAEVADMAITDMSDNANKMGTSMESIQTAYQGFAKQNYTMLDNLKLGYGGTKSEMERLLADAEKFSGVKYDISSLNDVYQAIHVVQTEMGITGTTAKEASATISGSIGAMKSAWQNMLTGLADGNANIGELVANLVDSVLTSLDNVLPVVEQIATSVMEVLPEILNKITENLPQFLEAGVGILNSLISGIQQNLPAVMNAVMTIVTTILNTLIQNLPQILQMGIQVIVSLVQGIAQQLPTLIPQLIDAVVLMVETILDNIDLIIDAGIQLIMGLADGLMKALPILIDKIPEIIDKLITAITDNLPKIIEMGITLTIKLAEGLIKAIPQLVSKIPQIIASLVKGIANYYSKIFAIGGELLGKVKDGIVKGISGMVDVGKNLVQGLWNGINNAKDWVLDKIKGFGKSILNGIKSFFGIHSPSTLFRDEVGSFLAQGVGVGFEDEMEDVAKDMQKSIPTDFDLGVNTTTSSDILNSSGGINTNVLSTSENLVEALQEALSGMSFKVDGDKFGELVIDNVEKVVYS